MKKVICFVLLFFSLNVGFSQTEEDYIQNIKVYYAKNIKSKACDEANKGLEKFPTSVIIAKLQALVCENIIVPQNPPVTNTPVTNSPVPDKIINVSTGFKRITGQNRVEWSKNLADNAVSISIRYTVKGVGLLVDEPVTGRTFHIYDPGTSRAHGRSTKVELIVDYGDKKVNESGILVLDNQFFVCSAN